MNSVLAEALPSAPTIDSKADWAAAVSTPEYRSIFGADISDSATNSVRESIAALVRRTLAFADEARFNNKVRDPGGEMAALWGRLSATEEVCISEGADESLLFGLRYRQACVFARTAWLVEDPELLNRAINEIGKLRDSAESSVERKELFLAALVEIASYACSLGRSVGHESSLKGALGVCRIVEEEAESWGIRIWGELEFYLRQTQGGAKAALGARLKDPGLLLDAIKALEWVSEQTGLDAPLEKRWIQQRMMSSARISLAHLRNDFDLLDQVRLGIEGLLKELDRLEWGERHWLEARCMYGEVLLDLARGLKDMELMAFAANVFTDLGPLEVLAEHPDLWLDAKLRRGVALHGIGAHHADFEILKQAHDAYQEASVEGGRRQWANTAIADRLAKDIEPAKLRSDGRSVASRSGEAAGVGSSSGGAALGGWHPNSGELDAAPPGRAVELESSIFPVEADFQFELRDAKDNAGAFEKKRVLPAEHAAGAWRREGGGGALVGATLYFNLGTRLCALGEAKGDGASIARAAESFRRAKKLAGAAEVEDPSLLAKIHHSLGYALFTAAETAGDLAGFQASAEASSRAAQLYADTGDPKRCGKARFNLALALTAVANRTGRVSDFTSAAGAFAQAAEVYATASEPKESAFALHRLGLIQLELGRRTGSAAALQEAAAVSAEAAIRFVASEDDRASATARDNQAIALTEAGDFEAAAAAAAEAAVRHAGGGSALGAAHAKFREGHALTELARASEGQELLQQAIEALSSAERGYVENGSERDLASALHNQGVCLLELGDRNRDSNAYQSAAAIFDRATNSHLKVGNRESAAVTEYYRGVALLNCAGLRNERPVFRQSAEASAAAASMAGEVPGGEEWHANARYNQGMAVLELAKRTDKGADFQEAAAVLEEAARCLRRAGHMERGAQAEVACEFALAALRGRAGAAKLDSATKSVAGLQGTAGSTGERGSEQIRQGSDAPTAPPVVRVHFAGASVGELESALVPEVPQAAIERLEELIREAQQAAPEDRESFVRSVNHILDAQNLRLEVEGEEHLARLTIKNGSLALLVAGGRGSIGFRRPVRVVAVPASYALRGARPRTTGGTAGP